MSQMIPEVNKTQNILKSQRSILHYLVTNKFLVDSAMEMSCVFSSMFPINVSGVAHFCF